MVTVISAVMSHTHVINIKADWLLQEALNTSPVALCLQLSQDFLVDLCLFVSYIWTSRIH